ncbi:cyclin-domain-containing protein [Westerdykella ornata]|uniref:Cyclin-domain-containing protein n=1 Tax=Westerdykella ornata TaxID=318751 RepID=A0A6A6JVT8_WESOR|nr:cyclin-domain-containing protein [Westerdykella ornata]KAF2280345.1 cyclin-domain-containing protein [Westerdykella ornata]
MLQSAPSSPSTFHHYASRRTSSSHNTTHTSPRFLSQVTTGSASARTKPAAAVPTVAPSPSPAVAVAVTSAPPPQKTEYKNASTQYSPTGYPPTYRPPRPICPRPPQTHQSHPQPPQQPQPHPQPPTANANADDPVPPEPAEPALRVDPQPAAPLHNSTPTRKATEDVAGQPAHQSGQRESQAGRPGAVTQQFPSPAKRIRPSDPASVKIMPLRYETCDVKDLGVLISDMLMELVRLNDKNPLRDGQLTRFHSRAPPGISVRDYLNRLIVHATLSPPILLSMVFYVDKLCTMYPAFTISSLTVHRFLITAATVAAKGLSDSFWTNSLYAKIGGVSIRELALLELEFLRRVEWRIVPKPETLVDYYKFLVQRAEGYEMEKEETSSEDDDETSAGEEEDEAPEAVQQLGSGSESTSIPRHEG